MTNINQIRIRCFASFTNSQNLHDSYERYIIPPNTIDFYGKDKKYVFTTGEDYTHVFIVNTAMPNISHIPKQNVIGFAPNFTPIRAISASPLVITAARALFPNFKPSTAPATIAITFLRAPEISTPIISLES